MLLRQEVYHSCFSPDISTLVIPTFFCPGQDPRSFSFILSYQLWTPWHFLTWPKIKKTMMGWCKRYPSLNIFAPENWWLEDYLLSFWGPTYFQVLWLLVSGRVFASNCGCFGYRCSTSGLGICCPSVCTHLWAQGCLWECHLQCFWLLGEISPSAEGVEGGS